MIVSRPPGVRDLLPPETAKWQVVEALLHQMCQEYGFGEIRTPIFEETELFKHGVGDTTDIVMKKMYSFMDQSGHSLTLRPEGTTPVCRAYAEHRLQDLPQPQKLYYLGPMFRYEQDAPERLRQFDQFGLEVIGTHSPVADAEAISFVWDYFHRLGLQGAKLHLNSVGCSTCRPAYREVLQDYLLPNLEKLCPACQQRYGRNPLRILDCKNETCQELCAEAPQITEYLCADCAEHFTSVMQILDTAAIPFVLDPKLVRGLDYYIKTTFEIFVDDLPGALCGGGRYDGLMTDLGGAATSAMGLAVAMERVLSALQAQNHDIRQEAGIDVYVVSDIADNDTVKAAYAVCCDLRKAHLHCEMDYGDQEMEAQLKAAERLRAAYAIVISQNDLAQGKVQVKNMKTGEQRDMFFEDAKHFLLGR